MPDQPEPRTVESGPVALTPATGVTGTQESSEEPAHSAPSSSEPTTPSPSTTTSSDDGEFVSIEQLKAMTRTELLKFCESNGLDVPVEAKNDAQDLLDWLLSEFGVDA